MDDKFRFSILTFPQRTAGGTLSFNVLTIPQISPQWGGNPLLDLPLGFPNLASTVTAFANTTMRFEARIIPDPGKLPGADAVAGTAVLAESPSMPSSTPDAPAIYRHLQTQFTIVDAAPSSQLAEAPKPGLFIKKYLPVSYRNAFHFTRSRIPEAVTDDSYRCAVEEPKEVNEQFVETPEEITWGKVYAYCLRHPLLARRLGLIRSSSIPIDATTFEDGGYLFVTLHGDSEYLSGLNPNDQFNFIRHYAARIPALDPAVARPLFAANLFPVLPPAGVPDGANYDQVFIDSADYDDGFCKIVHVRQPISQNLLSEEDDGFPPVHELGIQQSWEDEKVLEWQNRQLKEREDMPGTGERLDAPLGVFAYRVDGRRLGEGGWHSLVRVQSKNPLQIGPVNLGTFDGELGIEVHPMQLDGDQANGQFWLPSYFSAWNGQSLVLPDEDAAAVYHIDDALQAADNPLGRLYNAVGLDNILLRYGDIYEFRVRMMDATSGGPALSDEPVHEGEAPIAKQHFKRHIQPEPLRVDNIPLLPDDPLDTYFTAESMTVRRPLLGYPAVVYTGKYADPIPLLRAAASAAAKKDSFGIPDPDVLQVRVDVEVRTLSMDNKLSMSGDEPFIHLYTTLRDFPAAFDAPLDIPLQFVDANVLNFGDRADLGDLGVNENDLLNLNQLVLPRGREIRLTLRAVCDEDTNYFAGKKTATGKPVQLKVRRDTLDERDLLANLSPSRTIRGLYLQPDAPQPLHLTAVDKLLFKRGAPQTPAIIQRLADQLDVDHKGLTLVGEKGERVIFGCSRRIRHTLAPDHSSITFASKDELLNHWVVALTFQVDRDWTWDMVEEVSFELFRKKWFAGEEEPADFGNRAIGDLEMKKTAPINALQTPDRSRTTLIYLDAVEPKSTEPNPDDPLGNAFPNTIELEYELRPRFNTAPDDVDDPQRIQLMLPVTTPPAQVPRLASAGLALSPYRRDEAYSSTEPRERYLWLEFEEPVRDPNDSYFIRLLGYAPDPLLTDNRPETFVTPDEPPINLDPELIRVIAPGQSDDGAGLSAMQPLEPATDSDRHFLVPLPPGIHAESNELFGFFTYELRVGHSDIWTTAQGRFGRPLRTTGVQHPSPTLFCTTFRDELRLLVEAPHATAVLNGKNVTANPPRTEIWALLYVQVRQADGKDNRNLLLDERRLALQSRPVDLSRRGPGTLGQINEDATRWSATEWSDDEVKKLLGAFGLPADASLSVLCVEMMPYYTQLIQSRAATTLVVTGAANPILNATAAMAGVGGLGSSATSQPEHFFKPLSDQLGQFRMLRTSPLTAVPDIC